MNDVILLEGIQIPLRLGVTAAERRIRRPVRLDLEVSRDLRAAAAPPSAVRRHPGTRSETPAAYRRCRPQMRIPPPAHAPL